MCQVCFLLSNQFDLYVKVKSSFLFILQQFLVLFQAQVEVSNVKLSSSLHELVWWMLLHSLEPFKRLRSLRLEWNNSRCGLKNGPQEDVGKCQLITSKILWYSQECLDGVKDSLESFQSIWTDFGGSSENHRKEDESSSWEDLRNNYMYYLRHHNWAYVLLNSPLTQHRKVSHWLSPAEPDLLARANHPWHKFQPNRWQLHSNRQFSSHRLRAMAQSRLDWLRDIQASIAHLLPSSKVLKEIIEIIFVFQKITRVNKSTNFNSTSKPRCWIVTTANLAAGLAFE